MHIIGSKWFKVDFHCHSPASDDFPRNRDQEKCSYREWLIGHMSQEIDCVVLSDHNTAAGLEPIRKELKQLELEWHKNSENGYRPLTILPAVELTAPDNTHIIAIFRENASASHIEQFIGQLNPPQGQQNHQLVLGTATNIIIRQAKANSEDILIIPAHVDKAKGIFQNTNQIAVENVFKEEPHAIELVGNIDDLKPYQKNLIEHLAHVKGSDAHSINEMGRSYTWVKMSEPSFDGIKHALLDPKHCIIRSPQTPPAFPTEQITKLSIKSKLCQDQSGSPISIRFSPWYSALIGSRGSGKSTIVEAIRLGLRRDTDKYIPQEQKNTIRLFKEGALDTDSEISLEYRKINDLYKLTWSKQETKLYHRDSSGKWEPEETYSPSRFPISIYSQKMLYEIATEPNAFLSVIDSSPVVNYEDWGKKRITLEDSYKRSCSEHRHAIRNLEELTVIQGQYDDVKRKLKLLEKAGLKSLQERLSQLKAIEQNLVRNISSQELLICELNNIKHQNVLNIHEGLTPKEAEFNTHITEFNDSYMNDLNIIIEKYTAKLARIKSHPYYLEIQGETQKITEELNTKIDELASVNITPDELNTLLNKDQELSLKLSDKHALEQDIQDKLSIKSKLFNEILDHRKLLTILRISFIDSLNLDELKIRILPLSSSADSIRKSYQKYSFIERFSNFIFDEENSNSLLYSLNSINKFRPDNEAKRYEEIERIKQYHEDLICHSENGSSQNVHGQLKNRIQEMSPEQVDNLKCWFPEDGLEIKFKDSEDQFRQLDTASPGQKSASMLSFLMSYGTDPLILDQPEDDLDCGMLATSVIPAISKNKQRRQIIIVSHSAPIVVNGDAELIIAMKQQAKRLEPFITGGLQLKNIKEFICKQMEGGEPAFKSRFNRIIG